VGVWKLKRSKREGSRFRGALRSKQKKNNERLTLRRRGRGMWCRERGEKVCCSSWTDNSATGSIWRKEVFGAERFVFRSLAGGQTRREFRVGFPAVFMPFLSAFCSHVEGGRALWRTFMFVGREGGEG
jgi:hypothetical protein